MSSYAGVVDKARERWEQRQRSIATARRNADRNAWTSLDTAPRLVKRGERLGAQMAANLGLTELTPEEALAVALLNDEQRAKLAASRSTPRGPAPAEIPADAKAEAAKLRENPDRLDDRTFERIIGNSRDLLSVEFFELGLIASACVGLVSTDGVENGSGFLVGEDCLLTNWHVLEDAAWAARSDLMLNFEANRVGPAKETEIFGFDPDRLCVVSEELDYALVAVDPAGRNGQKLAAFGHLPMIKSIGKAVGGECVNIVQHPGGKAKQICIRNNRIVEIPGSGESGEASDIDPYLLYEADTERGSSGSPVCNDQWEVVALHHASLPLNAKPGQGRSDRSRGEATWIANEGIRTSRIVADLEAQVAGLESTHRTVLESLLLHWEQGGKPGQSVPVAESLAARVAASAATGPVPPSHTERRQQAAPTRCEIEIPIRIVVEVGAIEVTVTGRGGRSA